MLRVDDAVLSHIRPSESPLTEQESLHPLRPFLKNWLWEHGRVGTRYLDWELDDPVGRPLEEVRRIRDDIDGRVRELISTLLEPAA